MDPMDIKAAGGNATAKLGNIGHAVTARHYLRAPRRVVPAGSARVSGSSAAKVRDAKRQPQRAAPRHLR